MSIGTKSLLYGYHCMLIHPFVVARAWHRLFGFPFDPRLWVAFFVHDLGYWGKPDMDGQAGESHPFLGARIMATLFDESNAFNIRPGFRFMVARWTARLFNKIFGNKKQSWHDFTLYHSRFLARKLKQPISRLCVADKYAIVICPARFQLFLMVLTGELTEYMKGQDGRTSGENCSRLKWVKRMQSVCCDFTFEHVTRCAQCCRFSLHGECLEIPPSIFSEDGLSHFYCQACAKPVVRLAQTLSSEI